MSSTVSKGRYQYSYKSGKDCEDKFKALMEARNHKVTASSRNDNIYKHIDFYVDSIGVDVKGNRHLDCIWLELKNVKGNKGWLEGEAKFIVFDIEELGSFCFFRRTDLLQYVQENITEYTDKKEFNKFYTREKWGKKDVLVKVRYKDIKKYLVQSIAY
jgi:hypothetical protein